MTPAAAVRAYSRVVAGRALDSAGQEVQTAVPVADVQGLKGDYNAGTHKEQRKPDPTVPTDQAPPTTAPTQQAQPSRESRPRTEIPQPGVVPKSSSPLPVPPSGSEDSGPLFDRPDLAGKKEGDNWTVVRDGLTHTYTIPIGNGNRSVDQEVSRDGVTIGNSRLAYGENGEVRQWADVVGSASLYAEQESVNSIQYTQLFNDGTSTSGTPDSVLGTMPDLKTTFTLVDSGVPIGVLEQTSVEPGLYHTTYLNRDGDISVWRTNETEHGGLVTNPINYVDHTGHGWYNGNLSGGPLWEIAPKLDGSSLLTNTEITNNGTHVRVWDPDNETKSDKFYSNSGVGGYLASTNANGTTVDGDDGSHTRFDPLGKLVESRGPTRKDPKPDLRSNYERFTSFSRDVATGFELGFDELKTGIAALAGQQDRDVDGWGSRFVLSVMDGSLKDAWLGLATSGVGIGAGLAFTAIDIAAISVGQGSWNQLGRDILGTGNEVSIFATGADWTQAGKAPGETIGRALFGSMLLLGPKGLNVATSKPPPPTAVDAAIKNATNAAIQNTSAGFGNIGRSFGRPTLAPANVRGFPGAGRIPGPTNFATSTGSTPSTHHPGIAPNVSPSTTNPTGQTPRHSTSGTTGNRGSTEVPDSARPNSEARPSARAVTTSEGTLEGAAPRSTSGSTIRNSRPVSSNSNVGPAPTSPATTPQRLSDVVLPDGTTLGTRRSGRSVYGDAEYHADASRLPMAAVGRLDPPPPRKKIGLGKRKPAGFVDGMDNRGHMIPESGVRNQADANVQENSIAEHARLNGKWKAKWERAAIKYARVHRGVTMLSLVLERNPVTDRPVRIQHSLFDLNGLEIPGFTVVMYNPTTPGRVTVRTDPPNPLYPSP
ncbi:hypothetical protein [Nocardia fluminea]|uniref:hypothetical protein n=1 Tax=Nocardia fluminea TaxID=134984 RepID=UPI0034406562